MRAEHHNVADLFPFLFGGAFIEAALDPKSNGDLRKFPFLFGGAFIEAFPAIETYSMAPQFPFLFGGAFIEARHEGLCAHPWP